MKIKIIQAGWETYTGHMCGASFVDGVTECDARQAAKVGNIVLVENIDTGENPSDSAIVLRSRAFSFGSAEATPQAPAAAAAEVAKVYERAELEALADKGGIEGLRVVAPAGVKGRSISELIAKILDHQNAAKERDKAAAIEAAPNAPVSEPSEVVAALVAAAAAATPVAASWPFPAPDSAE